MLPRAMPRTIVYALCFCSGLAGLTYEVVWLRVLAVVVGNSAWATGAVLAATMCGLGVGARLVGSWADQRDPLRLYAHVEIGLGVTAGAVPFLAEASGAWVEPVLRAAGPGTVGFVARLGVAGALLFVPACLMGASVPVLVRIAQSFGRDGAADRVGPVTGVVYGLNTLGAALGCVLAGYVLLGAWGVRATNTAAAMLDVGVGLVALGLSLLARPAPRTGTGAEIDPSPGTALPRRLVLALAALAGACVLGLETLWTRILQIVFGHDVHAFAAMLASVLVGLALGAGAYGALGKRARASTMLVPLLFGLLAVSSMLSLALAGHLYLASGEDVVGLSPLLGTTRSHDLAMIMQPVFAALCVLLPATASGAIVPALCAATAPLRGAGRRVGTVLMANTLGAVVGALVTPFALVPLLGLSAAFYALASLGASGGILALLYATRARPTTRAVAAAGLIAAVASAALVLPSDLPRQMLLAKLGPAHLDVELYREGGTATVAVVRNRINGERQLLVNGINEVTTRLVHDQSFALLGHLGPLLHPDPRRVAVICLGAGISSGAVVTHRPAHVDIVDLEASVVPAARRFADLNGRVLDDDRVALVLDDGRSHLRHSARPYDVIVLDSTHPRAVDSWMLYTQEFYRTAAAALEQDGLLVQWLPLHGLSVDEFRIIVGTFLSVFPGATLWVNAGVEPYGPSAYALLLGGRSRVAIDARTIERALGRPGVRANLERWGLGSVEEILECFVAGPDALRRWTRRSPVNTDDLPYTQSITRFTASAPMTADRLLEVHEPVTGQLTAPPGQVLAEELRRRDLAQRLILSGRLDRAAEVCGPGCAKPPMFLAARARGLPYYRALRGLYPRDPERLREIGTGLAWLGAADEAVSALEDAVAARPEDPRVWIDLGLAREGAGAEAEAAAAYRRAIALRDGLTLARVNLGLVLVRLDNAVEAVVVLRRAVELDPDLAQTHAALGHALAHFSQGGAEATLHLERALRIDSRSTQARLTLGRLHLRAGDAPGAIRILRRGLRLSPLDADLLYTLAVAHARAGEVRRAEVLLRRLLDVVPGDVEAQQALAELE